MKKEKGIVKGNQNLIEYNGRPLVIIKEDEVALYYIYDGILGMCAKTYILNGEEGFWIKDLDIYEDCMGTLNDGYGDLIDSKSRSFRLYYPTLKEVFSDPELLEKASSYDKHYCDNGIVKDVFGIVMSIGAIDNDILGGVSISVSKSRAELK